MKNKKYLLFLLIIPLIVIMVGRSFAANFDHEIKSIEISSSDYPEAGSFNIKKSAEWIEPNKAQVTFDISPVLKLANGNQDIILVVDVSGSMYGEKIDKVKEDATELVDVLLSNGYNRVALVEFETQSNIELEFTSDKDLVLERIHNMSTFNCTNYNAALNDVDRIMENYVKQDGRSVTLMFLTDGYPNEDVDNQIATYHLLKEKYPYMGINGVQYEMGTNIIQAIVDISDNQWSAFVDTLHNVLFEASISPRAYSTFVLNDYIDDEHFYVESVNDIEVNMGEVNLEVENGVQKITWDLSSILTTASKAHMNIKLSLKDEYKDKGGFFPTNKRESVVYKLDNDEETINSNDTPVLRGKYDVIYDVNAPTGCNVDSISSESYQPYSNVTMKNYSLSCEEYYFRGWKIRDDDNEDITHINDDVFMMPTHNVRIVALWSKITPEKTMSGEVRQNANTIFDIMKMSSVPDDRPSEYVTGENGIDFTQPASTTNGKGVYELRNSMVVSDAENIPIYYYRGQVDNNFVLFAGYCWQIVRTTPDKGAKLIYYGLPPSDNPNQCNTLKQYTYKYITFNKNSDSHLWSDYDGYVVYPPGSGYVSKDPLEAVTFKFNESVALSTDYSIYREDVFNDSYWYADSYEYDENTKKYKLVNPVVITSRYRPTQQVGKYTFFSEDENATSDRINYVLKAGTGSYDSYLVYLPLVLNTSYTTVSNAVIGNSIVQNGDGTFTLTDTSTIDLVNFYTTMTGLNNKFICPDYSNRCKEPRYVVSTYKANNNSSSMYYSYYRYVNYNEYIQVANSINNGALVNPTRIRLYDFYLNSAYANYKYMCINDCNGADDLVYLISRSVTSGYTYNYNYKYANSITWDGSNYHLVDVIDFTSNISAYNNLPTHHYTCLNDKDVCSEVYYLITGTTAFKMSNGATDPGKLWFDHLKDVQVDENKNPINGAYNSPGKNILDDWYETNLLEYSKYLDDAVWCYDRSIPEYDVSRNMFSGETFNQVNYRGYYLQDMGGYYTPDIKNHPVLKCADKRDAYTVNDEKHGNALLKYPIALITGDEYILGSTESTTHFIGDGQTYWYTMSPAFISSYSEGTLFQDGSSLWSYGNVARRIKPSIVLKPNIHILSGDGTKSNPYQMELQ